MRLPLAAPDLATHSALFDLPRSNRGLSVTFLGVSTLLFDDGEHAILTDGFFSRPSLLRVGLGRIAPDPARVDAALARAGAGRLSAVVPVHTHFDHVLDSSLVAERTGALLVGGESAANVARGHGLAADRTRVVASGETLTLGSFSLTWIETAHSPPDRFPGAITAPVPRRSRARHYRCGESWSVFVEHRGGDSALVQGSAGFVPGALDGRHADVVYLGVGQLGVREPGYIRRYWQETVSAVGARTTVAIHWDDFFRPLSRPLRALPYAADDLDASIRVLRELAARDRVSLHLPRLWAREDPWAVGDAAA